MSLKGRPIEPLSKCYYIDLGEPRVESDNDSPTLRHVPATAVPRFVLELIFGLHLVVRRAVAARYCIATKNP